MRIAVLGAGPVGLETALQAKDQGHDVVVWERGQVGDSVRQWGHVTLFTPWQMNTTERGRAAIDAPFDPDVCPTGAELIARYLEPVAATLDVRTRHQVMGITKEHLRKGGEIGGRARAEDPFLLLVEGPEGAFMAEADAVIDCTGTWGDPVPAGAGGLEAPGEAELRQKGLIRYGPVAVDDLVDQRVLLIGDGASACTTLLDLADSEVTWLTLADDVPAFLSPEDDPLRRRRQLWERARRAAAGVRHLAGRWVRRFEADPVRAHLDDGTVVDADAVVVCAGFRPDLSLHRELQVHSCYASEGTMKLAAALLADSGAAGDCLGEQASGPELLKNPEPRFFVLGSKSYGRRNDFLLRTGYRQAAEALSLLAS